MYEISYHNGKIFMHFHIGSLNLGRYNLTQVSYMHNTYTLDVSFIALFPELIFALPKNRFDL